MGTTAKRSAPGPAWTRPARDDPSVCPTVRPRPAGSPPGRGLPGPADTAWLPPGLTIGSGLPLPHWSGRRRLLPRGRWGPAVPSSPPPPAPSCQLQPQRGPSPGPAEDPRGPRPGRRLPAVPRAAPHTAHPTGSAWPAARLSEHGVRKFSQGREAALLVGDGWRSGGSRGSQAREAVAGAAGMGALAASAGRGAQQHPAPGPPGASRCGCAVGGRGEEARKLEGQTRKVQVLK